MKETAILTLLAYANNTPPTGDKTNIFLWALIMFASIVAIVAIIFAVRKKKDDHNQ